jgi:hypothetical protein
MILFLFSHTWQINVLVLHPTKDPESCAKKKSRPDGQLRTDQIGTFSYSHLL